MARNKRRNRKAPWCSCLIYILLSINLKGKVFTPLLKTLFSSCVLLNQSSMLFCGIILFLIIGFVPPFENIILSFKVTYSWFNLSKILSPSRISLLNVGVLISLLISHEDDDFVLTVPLILLLIMLMTLSLLNEWNHSSPHVTRFLSCIYHFVFSLSFSTIGVLMTTEFPGFPHSLWCLFLTSLCLFFLTAP